MPILFHNFSCHNRWKIVTFLTVFTGQQNLAILFFILEEKRMIKNFVLDTNVLIHNPAALYSFADNNVIIPIMVIEELDHFKTSSDKKGMHARQILREIDALIRKGALNKGAKLKSGGTLRIALGPKGTIPNMDPGLSDNKILACAWELQEKGEVVFFISKDVNARIKSEAIGIKARDYEKEKVEYETLYKGWREVLVPAADISQLYSAGKLEVKGCTFNENEYALVKANDGGNTSALARYNSVDKVLVPLPKEYEAMGIRPLNMEQRFAFDLLLNDKIKLVTLIGQAGTGKTLLAIACALARIIGGNPTYKKMLVARPIMPLGKDIGYLPGTKDQKLNYWMQPIFDNLEFLLHRDTKEHKEHFDDNYKDGRKVTGMDKVDYLMKSNVLEIEALTYIRGRSIPNQFMIVDEAQNLTPHEIKTIVSRVGEGTKLVLTGDAEQIDNPYLDANSNGLSFTAERLKNQKLVGHMFLSKSERSGLASLAVELL
jgi:PhoH-like ATPase